MFTDRLAQALSLAIKAHNGQIRKETTIPYISHPMGVASLAIEHGADEDQVMAALLHDVIEDGGRAYACEIERQFGDRVAAIVKGCTDGVPDQDGQKAPWEERKTAYLEHLSDASADVLLVSGCDKLHNARAIVKDLLNLGPKVFDRFSCTQEQTLWYYESLAKIFEARKAAVAKEFRATVDEMKNLAQSGT